MFWSLLIPFILIFPFPLWSYVSGYFNFLDNKLKRTKRGHKTLHPQKRHKVVITYISKVRHDPAIEPVACTLEAFQEEERSLRATVRRNVYKWQRPKYDLILFSLSHKAICNKRGEPHSQKTHRERDAYERH